jgi:DNA-binding XRE family transcriptional regulator
MSERETRFADLQAVPGRPDPRGSLASFMPVTSTFSPPKGTPPSPLRLRRLSLGLTQAELGSYAGLSKEQVRRLEAGACEPLLGTARSLAAALGCAEAEIFPLNDDDPASAPGRVEESAGRGRRGQA